MLELKYQVVRLEEEYNQIIMTLRFKVDLPPPPVEQEPTFHFEEIPKTDEEKVAKNFWEAYGKYAPQWMKETFSQTPPSGGMLSPQRLVPLNEVKIVLTPEQYEELGSPPLLAMVKLKIEAEATVRG